jgi:hypothetical protein
MSKAKQNLILKLVACGCSMIVVITSVAAIDPAVSKANLIGIIAGSFGAGALLINIIKDHRAQRAGH